MGKKPHTHVHVPSLLQFQIGIVVSCTSLLFTIHIRCRESHRYRYTSTTHRLCVQWCIYKYTGLETPNTYNRMWHTTRYQDSAAFSDTKTITRPLPRHGLPGSSNKGRQRISTWSPTHWDSRQLCVYIFYHALSTNRIRNWCWVIINICPFIKCVTTTIKCLVYSC